MLAEVWPDVERLLIESKLIIVYQDRLEAVAHGSFEQPRLAGINAQH